MRELAGPLQQLGSPIMPGGAPRRRQLLWLETEWPDAMARRALTFWAARNTGPAGSPGSAASELTYLGAQSHLWDVRRRRFTPIVAERGWQRLMPPIRPAWTALGALKPELAARHDIPGEHRGALRHSRFEREFLSLPAGRLREPRSDLDRHVHRRPRRHRPAGGIRCHRTSASATPMSQGRPLAGVLAMGGREFAIIAGEGEHDRPAAAIFSALVEAGTMALPSFADHDGPFPGSARRGRIVGPQPETPGGPAGARAALCRPAHRCLPRRDRAAAKSPCSTAASSRTRSTLRLSPRCSPGRPPALQHRRLRHRRGRGAPGRSRATATACRNRR